MISTIYKTNALSSQTKQLNHTQCPHLTHNQCPLKKKNTRHARRMKLPILICRLYPILGVRTCFAML